MGGRILAMQSGFAMMEAAYVRPMNSANIMMKNMMDLFAGCLAFYLFGYKIAYGQQAVSLDERGFDWAMWFLQFSYATTAATIDSGALAGRVSFIAYIILSFTITGMIYPTVVNWVWGGGWLQEWGFVDFSGGSVVHLVGAVAALVSICVCGPRVGRFRKYRAWQGALRLLFVERNGGDEFYQGPQTDVEARVFSPVAPIHNPVQALFGVFLLLSGFLAFNPGATISTTGEADLLAARTSVTTLLTTTGAALTSFPLAVLRRRSLVISVPEFATVTMAGMVCSCGCCHVVPPVLALPVGAAAAVLADRTSTLLTRLQLDDVVGAVAAHGPPGILGVLCVPLLARPHCQNSISGLFFGGGRAAWELLGKQVCGIAAIAAFTAASTYVVVIAIDLVLGFRSNRATELIGHDFMEHGYEDQSATADFNRAMVIKHSPTRDCMKERLRSVNSPGKANGEAQARIHHAPEPGPPSEAGPPPELEPAAEPEGDPERPEEHAVEGTAALEREVRQLREEMRLLTTMLGRAQQVSSGLCGSGAPRFRPGGSAAKDLAALWEERALGFFADSKRGPPADGEAIVLGDIEIGGVQQGHGRHHPLDRGCIQSCVLCCVL